MPGGDFSSKWVNDSGTLVYSFAFLLNVVLVGVNVVWAGVEGNWK